MLSSSTESWNKTIAAKHFLFPIRSSTFFSEGKKFPRFKTCSNDLLFRDVSPFWPTAAQQSNNSTLDTKCSLITPGVCWLFWVSSVSLCKSYSLSFWNYPTFLKPTFVLNVPTCGIPGFYISHLRLAQGCVDQDDLIETVHTEQSNFTCSPQILYQGII